ncbi:MAG TPA: septal ring lytic transglycosylase RlpA family protein [Pseudolabrys sp.]|nr:septal ring lytic transglycosylase RlpA family protein [Pseudolabrys sp.]
MSPPASSPQRKRQSKSLAAPRGRAAIKFAIAIGLLCGMVWDTIEYGYTAISASGQSDLESETVVLPLAKSGFLSHEAQPIAVVQVGVRPSAAACSFFDGAELAFLELPVSVGEPLPPAVIRQAGHDMLNSLRLVLAGAGNETSGWVSHVRNPMLPKFASVYRAMRTLAAVMELSRIQDEASLARTTIIGTISTYNPYRDGRQEGHALTASGELYDPTAWTAAIHIDLRNQFGGIRYGRLYQPAFALVESGNKQVIVKVNDVGHLRPGRVLDLNERTMRYFDPFLTRGLLSDARITLLPGEGWMPGPIGSVKLIGFAAADWRAAPAQAGPIVPAETEKVLQQPGAYLPLSIQENIRAEARENVGG